MLLAKSRLELPDDFVDAILINITHDHALYAVDSRYLEHWYIKVLFYVKKFWLDKLPIFLSISTQDISNKWFLAYRIRISTCFTWTDNSYLTHVISPGAG